MNGPLVLVPVNRLDRAKGRLAEILEPGERVALAEATLETVIDAVNGAGFRLVVLSADERVRELLGDRGCFLAENPALSGLNEQIEDALARLDVPAEGLLILHADLPLATATALREFVAMAAPSPSVTLQPSADGGTNAMLLRPPGRFRLAYGAGSFQRHRDAAERASMEVRVAEREDLALDLDTPADIEALLAREDGRESRAGRLLARWGISERIRRE